MSDYSVQTKHVSHKISKVRWMPLSGLSSGQPTTFVTGGCDNDYENVLDLWLSPVPERNMADDVEQADDEPVFLCSSSQKGDVTDLLFVNESTIFSSSSCGDVNMFEYSGEFHKLQRRHKWSKLHKPYVTGMSATPGAEVVATVGKEGRINLLHQPLAKPDASPTVVTERACHTTPNAIKFLQNSTLAVVNNAGQLTIWDAGANKYHPAKVFQLINAVPFFSLDQHPSRAHIVVAGAEDGRLYVWDLRKEGKPVAIHRGHSYDVLEVKFHPDFPNNLFTCSEDGRLWHWGSNDSTVASLFNDQMNLGQSSSKRSQGDMVSDYWLLNNEPTKGKVIINDMLAGNSVPVNSVDVIGNRVVSGLDGDQVFVISDLGIC